MRPIFFDCVKYPTNIEEFDNITVSIYSKLLNYELVKPRSFKHSQPNKLYYSRYISDLVQDVIKLDPVYLPKYDEYNYIGRTGNALSEC